MKPCRNIWHGLSPNGKVKKSNPIFLPWEILVSDTMRGQKQVAFAE
jgi:hypothetical protein